MKIGELIQVLSAQSPEMEIDIRCNYGCVEPILEFRDILNNDTNEFKKTILWISSNPNYHQPPGLKHYSKEAWEKTKNEIVEHLKSTQYQYWRNGNRDGIFLRTGGSQDHCWTSSYDPRMWKELEVEGRIKFRKTGYSTTCEVIENGTHKNS